jgi:4-amino-4-deoxy-L-arabinose transferase-like glycosyltransferase
MNAHFQTTNSLNFGSGLIHSLERHIPILIIVFSILIRIPMVFIPQNSGFQHTTWRQTDTASIAHNFVDSGFNLFYPQVHWGGSGPGYVETEFQLYPFLTALLYGVFGEQLWLGLLVSMLFTIGTLWLFFELARHLLPPSAAIIALLFFSISPLYLRYSVVFMPEPAVLFFYTAALYLFHRWLNATETSLWLLIASAASTAMAILIKPTSIHIGMIFFLLLFDKYRFSMFKKWQIWLFAVLSLLPGVLWYLHARNLYLVYGNTFGIISGGDSKFDNLRYWFSPSFYASLVSIDLNWIFAIGGILPFAIGMILAWRKREPLMLIFGVITQLLYYLVIPRYTSFAVYYHIYLLPFASLAVGLGFLWLFQKGQRTIALIGHQTSLRLLGAVAAILVISFVTLRSYRTNVRIYDQPLWDCSQLVAQLIPQPTRIIVSTTSVAQDQGVENNYQEPNVFYYSHRYGWSLPADRHTVQQVDEYRAQGAEYLVVVDHQPLSAAPELMNYLRTNTQQIGPGAKDACSIFYFVSSS